MAITATQRNDLMNLVVGMFDAAPTAAILEGFVASIEAGATMSQMANDLAATAEFKSLYPIWLTSDEFATRFATNILDGNTDAAGLALAISEVKAMLANGMSYGDVALAASTFLANTPVTDPTFGQAAQALLNKSDVATYYATTKLTAAADLASLQAVLANVDSSADSVSNQKMLIDAALDSFAQNLTVGQDNLKGSAGNDAFTAWIFNNANTAQSGDMIDGGAGSDTLMAEIGNSQNFAISLKTNSVETAYFRVQSDDEADDSDNDIQDGGTDGIDGRVQIDAQDMVGTTAFWSTDARANLAIEDVRNNSHQTTLGWRNADAGNVNYEVYFDTQHITKPDGTTSGSQLFLEVLDLESMANGTGPLANSPYNGVSFTVDGTTVSVSAPTAFQTTYADLVAGLNAALAANPATTGITASLGATFSKFNSDNGIAYEGTTVVLTNTGAEVLGTGGWTTPTGELPADNNVHTKQSTVAPETTNALTQVDIIFDNIGRGSKSADFVAGNISQGAVSGSKGIQQFNIEVDRNSWVDTVRSTNNTLEVVNIENIGANGSIRIDDLNDVRVVDANTMTGAVTLDVDLTEAVIAKYLNLKDTDTNGASDNVTFTYTLGSNNDVLNLKIEEEAAAHEDFALLVSTGAGNDTVTTDLTDTGTLDLDTNWLADQQTLGNLVISTGSGDDTVTTTGEGNFTISTGSGNDTVYTNNDGNANAGVLVNEVQTITFAAAGETASQSPIIVDGVTVALADNDTAAQVAAKVQAALNNTANFTNADGGTVTVSGSTVTFTFDNTAVNTAVATGGDVAPIVVTATLATDATATQTTSGAAGVDAGAAAIAEVTNVTFGGAEAIGATVIFNGTTITLADTDASGTVELDEVAAQVAGGTYANFTVTDFDFSAGVVQFTAKTAGALADVVVGDFTGTKVNAVASANFAAVGSNVTAGTDGVAAGAAAVAEGQDILTFTAADFTGVYLITADTNGDDVIDANDTTATVSLTAGDSAITVASKAATAMSSAFGANFTVAHVANTATVTIDYAASLGTVAEAVLVDGALKGSPTVTETTSGQVASTAAAATWVVGATNTEVADLKGTALTNSLLFGATVTVTFSGASIAGTSGVTDGDAVRLDKGFEKTITLTTVDNLGNQRSINQAIKDAILNDDVLQEFLTVKDGPANTLIITSLVDGRFDEDDLQINLNSATVSTMASADVTSLKATLNDINNTSNATVTDGALQTALDAAVATYATSNVLTKFAMGTGTTGQIGTTGVQIQGNASVTESDNVVNLGSGSDVVVLGTDANSNDVIVVAEAFSKYSVLNFVTTGTGLDVLNFGAYLNTETSVSGSAASSVLVAATLTSVGAATGDTVAANEVTIINDFTGTTTQTFALLDASNLLAAINTSNTGSANYGNITENTLESAGALANLVGSTRDHIVMIENEANDGEYKVFHLTSANNVTNGDFASATLLGTIDFGDELVGMSASNISIVG